MSGQDNNFESDNGELEDIPMVTLTLDDDEEVECIILTIYEAGGKEYIALLPADTDEDEEESDVFLYRYLEDANGEPDLANIEDDEEYEIAADAFDEWLDLQDFENSDE